MWALWERKREHMGQEMLLQSMQYHPLCLSVYLSPSVSFSLYRPPLNRHTLACTEKVTKKRKQWTMQKHAMQMDNCVMLKWSKRCFDRRGVFFERNGMEWSSTSIHWFIGVNVFGVQLVQFVQLVQLVQRSFFARIHCLHFNGADRAGGVEWMEGGRKSSPEVHFVD